MKDMLSIASAAALKAGGILRDNIHGIREITLKGDINLVTEMDMRSERAVVETLLAAFPGHGIIAEEGPRYAAVPVLPGSSIPLTAPRTMRTAIPAFPFRSRLNRRERLRSASCTTP